MKLLSTAASNCTLLAATLSSLYGTYDDSNFSSQPLEHFLDGNGILLTMCMRFFGFVPWLECSLGKRDTKISASWISQNKTGGFRVIGVPIDVGPPVGLVLRPSAMTIRCLFPADAVTDGRDAQGCGPMSSDARYGSKGYDHTQQWWKKALLREEIIHQKNSLVGQNRSWDSIPCEELAPVVKGPPIVMGQVNATTTANGEWEYWSDAQFTIDQWSHTMGFPVCNVSGHPPPPPRLDAPDQSFLYLGNRSWSPEQWPDAIQRMEEVLEEHPSLGIWNEVVLDIPLHMEDAVQAVFYIKGRDGAVKEQLAREIAKREANRLQKHLLSVDLSKIATLSSTDLFQCAEPRDEDDGAEEGDLVATGAEKQQRLRRVA